LSGALEIKIVPQRDWGLTLFLLVALAFLGLGGGPALFTAWRRLLAAMATSQASAPGVLMVVFSTAIWVLLTSVFGSTLLWRSLGYEVVRIDQDSLSLRSAVWKWGRNRRFDSAKIARLEVAPPRLRTGFPFVDPVGPFLGGLIKFEYEGKVIRFGKAIEEALAHEVLEKISSWRR
jgi:hypothetical protein